MLLIVSCSYKDYEYKSLIRDNKLLAEKNIELIHIIQTNHNKYKYKLAQKDTLIYYLRKHNEHH